MTANYVLINETTVSTPVSSVTISNIPQTQYTDLKLVISGRSTFTGGTGDVAYVRFNSTTTGYSIIRLQADGNSVYFAGGSEIYFANSTAADTTSTFCNAEVYIPNFTSSTVKSVVVNSANENSGTAYIRLGTGLSTLTSAINQLVIYTNNGNWDTYSSFALYGIAKLGVTPTVLPKASGGDIINNDGTYWYHTFLSSGVFTPTQTLSCDFLVIAGGGGGAAVSSGGNYSAPGGGAGGYKSSVGSSGGGGPALSPLSLSAQQYPVIVGAGGAGNAVGSLSSISTINTVGGGQAPNGNGGSGAGAFDFGTLTPGTGATNEGYAGGAAAGSTSAGGGGGAGGVGSSARTGGAGLTSSISGSSVARAGGGGAGWGGTATAGGGAGGAASTTQNGSAGTVNTGGGGGGASVASGSASGGAGGSGVVIVRYTVA
jgi:hypothetical protein